MRRTSYKDSFLLIYYLFLFIINQGFFDKFNECFVFQLSVINLYIFYFSISIRFYLFNFFIYSFFNCFFVFII